LSKIRAFFAFTLRAFFWLILVLTWIALSASIFWDSIYPSEKIIPEERNPVQNGYNYLIIAPATLKESASKWAEFRESDYQVELSLLLDEDTRWDEQMKEISQRIADEGAQTDESRIKEIVGEVLNEYTLENQIKEIIQETYKQSGEPYPFFVLLIGSEDPNDSSYLPRHRYIVPEEEANFLPFHDIEGDAGYTFDTNNDRWLPIAIGRIPLSDNFSVLQKLKNTHTYENNPLNGLEHTQVNIIASDGGWGPVFAKSTELALQKVIETELSLDTNYHVINGNYESVYSVPKEQYTQEIIKSFEMNPLWVSYVGHGGSGLGPAHISEKEYAEMFTVEDVSSVGNAQNTMMTFVSCTSEELAKPLFSNPGGPIATISSSRITFAYSNTFLQKDLMLLLINDQVSAVGEWMRLAKIAYRKPEMNRSFLIWLARTYLDPVLETILGADPSTGVITYKEIIDYQIYTYNLYGDPALQIPHAKRTIDIQSRSFLTRKNSFLFFDGKSDLDEGAPLLVFIKYYPGKIPVIDSAIPANSVESFNAANDFILGATAVTTQKDGTFSGSIEVPDVPNGAYVLEVITPKTPTSVGHDIVYIGFPFLFLFYNSKTWWLVLTIVFFASLFRSIKKRLNICNRSAPHLTSPKMGEELILPRSGWS